MSNEFDPPTWDPHVPEILKWPWPWPDPVPWLEIFRYIKEDQVRVLLHTMLEQRQQLIKAQMAATRAQLELESARLEAQERISAEAMKMLG